MTPQQILENTKTKFASAVDHFGEETKKLRTGRAHPSMLDGVQAEAYGQKMPLIQLATISVPESQLLQITPFDVNNIEAISSAIRENQTLGINPMDDGRVIRVPIPPLNEERRIQIVKLLHEKVEECMISLRQARQDTNKELEKARQDKDLGQDEYDRLTKQVDDLMADHKSKVEETAKAKETDILKV